MRYRGWLIGGGMVTTMAIGIYGAVSSTAQGTWQSAGEVAPPELLTQIAQEHLSSDFQGDLTQMQIWKIQQSGQATPLYLVDTRLTDSDDHPLCGQAGCAFLAYIPDQPIYRSVFVAYLNPYLPPDTELFSVGDQLHAGLPDLILYQLEAHHLQRLTLAFQGDRYEVVETQILPETYE
jgi:hypothetical protein